MSYSSYDLAEVGTYTGQDVRLYEFTRQGFTWYYNGGDRDITYNSQVYVSTAISDGGIKQKGDSISDDFVITLPSSLPIPVMFNGTPPSDLIKVVMRMLQYGDTVAPIMWLGYISGVKSKDEVASEITSNTQAASLQRKGLRMCYERMCPHALYDDQCGVATAAWALPAIVSEITGNSFTYTFVTPGANASVVANPGCFTNGFFAWPINVSYSEQRAILLDNGGTPGISGTLLTLNQTDGLTEGMTITLYPGCDRTPNTCLDFFDNIANYGGYPFMPGRSPFDGNPVF
jgi:uncharacterized phage protein (TIGR02218 family)